MKQLTSETKVTKGNIGKSPQDRTPNMYFF